MKRIVVIGAGFGGLSTATELALAGQDVTVLEAHVYAGGCASTYFHQGYRFEAGATLAGGFAPGAPMDILAKRFKIDWEVTPVERTILVHLPGGATITRYSNPKRWQSERLHHFGKAAEPFWEWQEQTADTMWDLAMRLPAWPPNSLRESRSLLQTGFNWLGDTFLSNGWYKNAGILPDAFRKVSSHLPNGIDLLKLYVDGQLLISAQTTSSHANALYGASALDLPRRGVGHIPGGMGGMADKMVSALTKLGGHIHFRQEVTRVQSQADGSYTVHTKRKANYTADIVIFNLPPWNIAKLLDEPLPSALKSVPKRPKDGWGAFMVYVGFDEGILPNDFPLHHQVIAGEPLGEVNSIFLSISPGWDPSRAPAGKRALTVSSHTQLEPWWNAYDNDEMAYEARKTEYTESILSTAETVLPGLRSAAELILPGTPVTFQRFTRRAWGWVGGFPQTNLLRTWSPRLGPGIWMVGDSIFPGQSVPAVSLGGLRVAQTLLSELSSSTTNNETDFLNISPEVERE